LPASELVSTHPSKFGDRKDLPRGAQRTVKPCGWNKYVQANSGDNGGGGKEEGRHLVSH